MSYRRWISVPILLLGFCLALPADAGKARRSRSGGGDDGGKTQTATRPSGGAGGTSARAVRPGRRAPAGTAVASGTASWRQGRFGGRSFVGYRYYPYYYGWYAHHYPAYPSVYWWCGVPWLYGPYFYGPAGTYHGAYYGYAEPDRSGVIVTHVKPKRANVVLNGEAVGEARDYTGTWDELRVPAGQHVVELQHDGYRTLRLFLTVEPGDEHDLRYRLEPGEGLDPRSDEVPPPPPPKPERDQARPVEDELQADVGEVRKPRRPAQLLPSGFLRFDIHPRDASIYLDGEYLALASELARLHGAIPVASGTHRIEVVRPGYATRELEVEVPADDAVRIELVLKRD